MDKLLDKEVHQLYKAPSLTTYLSVTGSGTAHPKVSIHRTAGHDGPSAVVGTGGAAVVAQQKAIAGDIEADEGIGGTEKVVPHKPAVASTSAGDTHMSHMSVAAMSTWQEHTDSAREAVTSHSLDYLNLEQNFSQMTLAAGAGARPKTSALNRYNRYAFI